MFVDVRDQRGDHVSGLQAANFKAEYRGQPVTIVSVTEDSAPRRVAVVVDTSASQSESVRYEWAEAKQLIDRLIPQHAVAVFTVDRTLRKFGDFTLEQAMHEAGAQMPSGSSSLYGGLAQLGSGLSSVQSGDAICLFSDGDDTSSLVSADQLQRVMAAMGIRMFMMGNVTQWKHEPEV